MPYTLRDGCEMPVHGKIDADDRKHPQYSQYLCYRAAMSAQLVRCPAFKDWLVTVADDNFADDYDDL